MKVIKLLGKVYDADKLEENSKIVRMWLIVKQIKKEDITGKHHTIADCNKVIEEYKTSLLNVKEEDRKFYEKYLNENWRETHPIMKDVSSFKKIRPTDGTEFCVMI